jgi:hypothetical protein
MRDMINECKISAGRTEGKILPADLNWNKTQMEFMEIECKHGIIALYIII